ncbi:putative RNA exonuclease NEF-sp like protein [Danaus plexippus plexippus]|uniref:RNA exonuclease NEF-sp like protein n=1 Tax=Danaus plexippus plexippus TaxID=278856 RepID=A0A212FDG9_DANPL|nr:putative RNA exonuclease NEF-sp like protein [Danaus plexippus plexippus]
MSAENGIFEEPVSKKRRLDSTKEKPKTKKKPIPVFRLKPTGETASLFLSSEERVPLVLTDIQHLLLHSLFGNLNLTQPPRWYTIDKCNHITQTTCLIIEGISIQDWENYQDMLKSTHKIFDSAMEVLTPSVYNGSLVKEMALVPLSENEKETLIQKYGSMNLALEVRKDLMVMMKAVFPIRDEITGSVDVRRLDEKFPRTQLMLSAWQLIDENYPVPLKGKLQNVYADYVMTKEEYSPVTAESPMFGLDCEMCLTKAGSELTRVSIVNEKHETVYESFVKPYNQIMDYLTQYSGITEELLRDVTKRLEDVQKEIQELLPSDAILVGQSLNSDLHALRLMHPYIIDTSLIYNFTGERYRKPKLKTLAKEYLKEEIQTGTDGHCSVEDSLASLKLVQLKLSKSVEFGDAVHTKRQKYKEEVNKMVTEPHYALSIFNHIIEQKKTSVIIGCDNITGDYHTFLTQAKESLSTQLKKGKPKRVKLNTVDSMDEVITTLTESVKNYNLVMGHLKLEASEDDTKLMQTVDGWVETVWNSIQESAICVIVFGGTVNGNGVAMMKVKT